MQYYTYVYENYIFVDISLRENNEREYKVE